MHRTPLRALLVLLLLGGGAVLQAALPTFWRVATEPDFLKGEVENLAIDPFGRLSLGPSSASLYEASAPFLWTTLTLPDGALLVGSGNDGQVYRIERSGQGRVLFDAGELEVHALAPAPNGQVYVATAPDGKVYRVDARGAATVFFDPIDRYIWALAVDPSGNLFVATGDKGVVYRVTPDGQSSRFYDTKATHAMALHLDAQGRLFVGTASPGRVIRLDAAGRPFVVLDSGYAEVRTLRADAGGTLFALAVNGRPGAATPAPAPAPEATSQPVASVSTEISAVVVVADTSAAGASSTDTTASRGAQGGPLGALFRIAPDGLWDLVWESREDTPYDVLPLPGGDLVLATGNKGKIFRLSGDPLMPTLVARANAQQVTALVRDAGGQTLYATSNPGRLMRLSQAPAARGTYTSDVRDAQSVATWGTLRWQATLPAGTRVEISTRAGNTSTPDDTWSEWSAAYPNADGTAITSPKARYLQWRAVLVGSDAQSPVLTSVTAAYLPRNARPKVTGLTIHPPGTVFQRPFPNDPEIAGFGGETIDRRNLQTPPPSPGAQPALGRRAYQKGLLTFVWRAEDENRDELVYDIAYRREGDTTWKILRREEAETIMVWDTTSVPDGRYLLRISASDARSNAPALALTGVFESQSFDIDNTPPALVLGTIRRDGGRTTVSFDARDGHSPIQRADVSVDGTRWVPVYPRDGIIDARSEQFEAVLDGDPAPGGVLLVRVMDALQNTATTTVELPGAAGASGRR